MKYGRYQVKKELGRGTMGVVYQAHDPRIDRMVALKILRTDRVASEDFVSRFLKEAKAIGRLSHQNIVMVHDVGKDHGTIYIAMEYIEGVPFNTVVKEGKLDFEQIVNIGIQAALTLDHAHSKGIVHRDIKPSNIIMTQDGQIKLTDFGIARIEDPDAHQQTQAGDILGTPVYMPPEQVLGRKVDGRSDLYSLGVILYEIALKKRPFSGSNIAAIFRSITDETPELPSDIDPFLPTDFSDLIMKSLEKDPAKRFQSGRQMADALNACLKNGADSIEKDKQPVVKKSKMPVVVIACILVAVAALAAYLLPRNKTDGTTDTRILETKEPTKPEQLPATLKMTSRPSSAQVYIDNQFKGTTPMDVKLAFGKYEVRLNLPEHFEWEAQINIDEEGDTPLDVRLAPMD